MHWEMMTQEEYAQLELQLGEKIVKVGNVWWRRVRPFLYRAVFYYGGPDVAMSAVRFPWPVAFQYPVRRSTQANSVLSYLALENLQEYTSAMLEKRARQSLKKASAAFVVAPIADPGELKRSGYEVYVSFYERTRYRYLKERLKRSVFERWVDVIWSFGKPLVLGGYEGDKLKGVSVSYRVEDVVICATQFIETEALKGRLGDLLLHEIRTRAAQEPGLKQVFLRAYQGGNSRDTYYLERGARLVRQPARLHIDPIVAFLVRRLWPDRWNALVGNW